MFVRRKEEHLYLTTHSTHFIYGHMALVKAGRSSDVERSLMVRWVIGSIPHGGLIQLFLVPASAPRLV